MLQFGKIGLNPEAFKDTKKEDFKKKYAGRLDVDKAWREIQKALPKKKRNEPGSSDTES